MAAASEGRESDVTQCSLQERMMMRMRMMVMRPCDLIKSWLVLPMWSLRFLWASSAAAMIFLHLSIKKCGWECLFLEFLWLVFYHFLPWQLCIILTLYLDMAVWTTMSTSLSLSQSIALVQTKISNQLLNGLAWKSVQILYCSQRRNLTDCNVPNHWELDAKWYTRNNVSHRTILKTVVIH